MSEFLSQLFYIPIGIFYVNFQIINLFIYNLMKNESFSADISQISITQPLKPQIYQFDYLNPQQNTNYSKFRSEKPNFSKFYSPQNHRHQSDPWKPKISAKKLMQDPKFLISLQRKKRRIISGLRSKQISQPQSTRRNPKNEPSMITNLKFKAQSRHQQPKQDVQATIDLIYKPLQQKTHKTPYLKFNLHHLIKRKKNMDSNRNNAKGSSDIFYKFYFSSKHNQQRPISTSNTYRIETKRQVSSRFANTSYATRQHRVSR